MDYCQDDYILVPKKYLPIFVFGYTGKKKRNFFEPTFENAYGALRTEAWSKIHPDFIIFQPKQSGTIRSVPFFIFTKLIFNNKQL